MSVTVQASKHPLKPDWVYAEVESDQSIYEISGGAPVEAYINGRQVPEELHRLTKVKDGMTLVLWPIPQDDEIKSAVGQIVVAIAAAVTAVAVTAATGNPYLGAAAGAAVAGVGSYAVNKLIPPPTPERPDTPDSFNRLEAITGQSNQVGAFSPLPRLYGTFRFFPPLPMTARPYTEIKGDDQFLRMFMCLGYGPLEIGGRTVGAGYSKITEQDSLSGTPLKIGETDLNQFEEVEYEIGSPDQMTLYSDQVIESNPGLQANNDGDSAVRATEPNTDEISIAIAGRLFSINDKAKTRRGTVRWRIEYREIGATDWIVEEEDWVISSSKKETVREGYRWRVPNGQYEVRLTRKSSSFAASTDTVSDFAWNALRSIRSVQPFDVEGTVCMALRIRATDQLNGRIDDLSVLATSVLDVYDGSQWVKQATNNPAWIYSDIWTGSANRRPLLKSDLDTDSLVEWANYCDQEGFYYNNVFDSSGTTFERAREVVSTGLANWNFSTDAKIGVIRDVVQTVPKMIISPRNSFAFNYELAAVEVPDALRVRFVDDFTWENTERLVFDDGFDESNAEKYETLEAKGVTNADQAWKFGRYHLAQQRLRPERYNFKQEVQHLRYTRGDMLTIQYDTILVGLAAGRIKEVVSDTEIVLDEVVQDNGKNYGVKIQHSDGTISTVTCTLGSGPTNTTVFLDNAISKVSVDDLVVFGEAGKESIDVKVSAIEPEGNFLARISCVPAADEIEQAFDGDIPPFDPVITSPVDPSQVSPKQPKIEAIRSDESTLYADDDGSLRVRMLVETAVPAQEGWDQKTQIRYRAVGDNSFETLEPSRSGSFSIFDVDEGVEYEVQARGLKNVRFSPWTDPTRHTVIGKSTPPPDVSILNAVQNDENVVFRWRESVAPDLDGYEIRFGEPGNSSWNDSIKIAEAQKGNVVTEADVPPGTWRFYIKAVDTSGNYSRNATTRDLEVVTAYEDLRRTVHNPDWGTGQSVGFVQNGTVLQADNNEEAYFVADTEDLGFDAKRVRVWAQVQVGQSNVDDTEDYGLVKASVTQTEDYGLLTDSVTDSEDLGALLTGIPVSDPLVVYEIATRNEGEEWTDLDADIDRYGKITSSVTETEDYGLITDNEIEREVYDSLMGWTEWTRGEVDARYIKQRVRIRSDDDDESGLKLLRKFTTVVDVPERQERAQGLTVDPGGSTFTFDRRFHLRPVVTAVVESDNDLFPIRKSVDNSSVTFVVRDSAGNDVGTDNLDYIATGV